uniref:Adiponectin receptor protein n=1 Tax=Panagrellus redivivus TaxID=6233 RepID=A0A7E4W3C0_PANRE
MDNDPPKTPPTDANSDKDKERKPSGVDPTITPAPAEDLPYPLDIVVHKINQAVLNRNDDDSDDDAVNEVNYELKKEGFKITNKDYGADCVYTAEASASQVSTTDSVPNPSISGRAPSSKFRKGHRRAWSMPNANRDKAVLIVADDSIVDEDGDREKHLVRYRLHPYRTDDERSAVAVNDFIQASNFDMHLPLDDAELDEDQMCFGGASKGPVSVMKRIWEATWKAQSFDLLPAWLQDNEYLRSGHRPPLPSFVTCFQSIFEFHTETGNIWTHLYGCLAFVGVAVYFMFRPTWQVSWMEKFIFSFFFIGAICCLGLSCCFHTVQCHSIGVGKLFSKLDYSGITMLIVGSFIPWIYYGFYCRSLPMVIYMTMITVLGIAALIVSLWDKFAEPAYRPVRAIVFVCMGLSSVVPAAHMLFIDGTEFMFNTASLHWLLLMGAFYLTGAALYASRFPERFFPGKCDYVFQSHQLFHTFVVIAAYIHFHGITEMAMKRLQLGSCIEQMTERFGIDEPTFMDRLIRPH